MGLVPEYPPLICGLDPGQSGGIAFIGDGFVQAYKMPATEKDIAELLIEYCPHIVKAYIEAVHAFPKQGVSSTFKFGQNYGLLRGLLVGLMIPFEEVSPQRWQKDLSIPPATTKDGKKNQTKAKAQRLWPQLRIIHAIADSLLIAEWGRRQK